MTVEVSIPNGTHVFYDVNATEAFTSPVSDEVQARGDDVYGYLLDMEATADYAASEALSRITDLRNFSAAVGAVSFDAPDAPSPVLEGLPEVQALTLTFPEVDRSDLDTGFIYARANAVAKTWAAPEDSAYVSPEAPGLGLSQPLPDAPSDYVFPDTEPPEVDLPAFVGDNLTAPNLQQIALSIEPLPEISDFTIDVDTQGLLDLVAQMESFDPQPPELPPYAYLIPEIFEVTGAMAAGDPIVNYVSLLEKREGLISGTLALTAPAFQRRALRVPQGAQEYDTWLKGVVDAKGVDSDTIFTATAIDDAVKAALELGSAAHRLLVDISKALYDLEFSAAKAAVNARVEAAKVAASIYQAEVLILRSSIAQYNAQAAQIEGAARAFTAQARQAAIIGQSNMLEADIFSTQEQAKRVELDVYKSRLLAEAAKLKQYRAVIESYKGAVASAQLAVVNYGGTVQRYAAEVDRITTDYDIYATEAQATQFENASRVAALQADQSELRAFASVADSSAAQAAAEAVRLQARAAVREAQFTNKALQQDEAATEFDRTVALYNKAVADYSTDLTKRALPLSSNEQLARSVAGYVRSAQEALGRSAQLSQTANMRLAQAYATVYEAAGKAGAAVASGKLSGFRASATLGAAESLRASNSYGVGITTSGTNSLSESDDYNA